MGLFHQCNLDGCKQAAQNWYLHLKASLEACGFVPSKIDPCLYIQNDCIIALYTDDCLIFADSDKTINLLFESLSSDFLLKDEGDIEDFLGIHISKSVNKADNSITYTMMQPGLIKQILQDIGLAPDCDDLSPPKGKFTPANAIFHPYPDAAPFSVPWNYCSVIGKLNFLAQNT